MCLNYGHSNKGEVLMSYHELETAFQYHIATEPCWNIPTTLRMGVISSINALYSAELDDSEKLTAFYAAIQEALELQPDSELETRQMISLNAFARKHTKLSDQAKHAILHDLFNLEVAEPVTA
jgi:hypothetical protein